MSCLPRLNGTPVGTAAPWTLYPFFSAEVTLSDFKDPGHFLDCPASVSLFREHPGLPSEEIPIL